MSERVMGEDLSASQERPQGWQLYVFLNERARRACVRLERPRLHTHTYTRLWSLLPFFDAACIK
jgi:hypothetical protein